MKTSKTICASGSCDNPEFTVDIPDEFGYDSNMTTKNTQCGLRSVTVTQTKLGFCNITATGLKKKKLNSLFRVPVFIMDEICHKWIFLRKMNGDV